MGMQGLQGKEPYSKLLTVYYRPRWHHSFLSRKNFETKHPIILDSRHLLVKLCLRHLHFAYNYQHFDYLRFIVHMGFVVFGLRAAFRATERSYFVCRRRKVRTLHPTMSDLPVRRLGYRHRPFSNCCVD